MYDIHTHLYWQSYDEDREAVLARAKAAGIEKMIVVGCTPDESRQAVELAHQYPALFASVGIHPHWFNELGIRNQESISQDEIHNSVLVIPPAIMGEMTQNISDLREITNQPKVIAIGECGLDYFSHDSTQVISEEQRAFQREGFRQQIALAEKLALPLIIHTRPSNGSMDAYEDMLAIMKVKGSELLKACILHCYMGDTEITKKFLEIPNLYFSFAGNITYPVKKVFIGSKDDLGETVKLVPLERILAETDCPFLSPQAHRGERNEPAFVMEVARKVAEIKQQDIAEITKKIEENSQRIFRALY